MRRIEIISAVNTVVNALVESKLPDGLQGLVPRRSEGSERVGALPVEAMSSYFIAAGKFGAAEREIIQILELAVLNEPEFWAIFTSSSDVVQSSSAREIIYPVISKVNFAINHLPKFVALLERRHGGFSADIIGEPSSVIHGKSVISTTLIENENEYSKPQRLSGLFESINDLYEVCAAVNGEPGDDLIVVACDSGSDKSFDFMGGAKIVEALKELILSVWDRAVFYREHKMSNHLELVSQALPILDQISEMEEQNKLGKEEAQILRQKVANGAGKFLETGVIIPEMESVSTQNPRALMAPEPKQLVAATLSSEGTTNTSSGGATQSQSEFNIDNLSEEQRMLLLIELQNSSSDVGGDGTESNGQGE